MSPANIAIFINILVYLIYVLVPMIPAILIYTKFPDTKVGASGVLGNLKVNSTGAFAAYIVVVTMGYFIIQNIQQLNNASIADNTSWIVKSKVVFYDKGPSGWEVNNKITDDSVKARLEIIPKPDYNSKNLGEIVFMTYYQEGLSTVSYTYPGYISQIKMLCRDSVTMDYEKRTIDVGRVELRRLNQLYKNDTILQANSEASFSSAPDFK